MKSSYLLAGNQIRFRFNGFHINTFFIVDLPDIGDIGMVTFSNASMGEKHIIDGKLHQPLVVFGKGVHYSDVTFFDTKGNLMNSCMLLVPYYLTDDYKLRNKGHIGDMFPDGSGISRCRPPNIRLLPWCHIPSEYLGDETHYLRVYLFNADGTCEIVNTREQDYHVIENYTKPIIMAETWIGGCSIVDTYRKPSVIMAIYHNRLLI